MMVETGSALFAGAEVLQPQWMPFHAQTVKDVVTTIKTHCLDFFPKREAIPAGATALTFAEKFGGIDYSRGCTASVTSSIPN